MKILVDKSFPRDAERLPIPAQTQLTEIIEKLTVATSLQELSPSKMGGASNAYPIRFGNYRTGIYLEGNQIVLCRVVDRKDIYEYFPKK